MKIRININEDLLGIPSVEVVGVGVMTPADALSSRP
jgi:hypothetical protein